MTHIHIQEQVKQHFLSIIGLIVAVTALVYSTWREELTEKNLNTRLASFDLLKNLGQLQVTINFLHFDSENSMGNPLTGWGYIALINDLGEILPDPIPMQTKQLVKVWGENWNKLKTDQRAVEVVSAEVDASRKAVLDTIHKLR